MRLALNYCPQKLGNINITVKSSDTKSSSDEELRKLQKRELELESKY